MWRSLPATSGPQVLNLWPVASDTWIWAMQLIFGFSVEYFLNNFSLFLSGLWKYEPTPQLLSYQPAQGRMPIAAWDKSNSKTCPRPPSLAAALAFHLNGIASLYFQAASGVSTDPQRKRLYASSGWGFRSQTSETDLQIEIWKSILTLPFLFDPFQTLGLTFRFLVSNLHFPFALPEYTEMESVRSLFY